MVVLSPQVVLLVLPVAALYALPMAPIPSVSVLAAVLILSLKMHRSVAAGASIGLCGLQQ